MNINESCKHYFKIIGPLDVSLTSDSRWRRRYLVLYPPVENRYENLIKEGYTRPQILIFPRQSAKQATARIRLTSSHGIQYKRDGRITTFQVNSSNESAPLIHETKLENDEEDEDESLIFQIMKRSKTTLYVKVSSKNVSNIILCIQEPLNILQYSIILLRNHSKT